MKWDHAIIQQNSDVDKFVPQYFHSESKRHPILICGAGFDPRSLSFPRLLSSCGLNDIQVLCIREERIMPQPKLRPMADKNDAELKSLFGNRCNTHNISIFDRDGGIVGGRNAVRLIHQFLSERHSNQSITDIIVDISALSCGIFFPIVAHIIQHVSSLNLDWNIHLLVAENPVIDSRIKGVITDVVSHVHGYRSRDSLSQTNDHAILWVPVLAENNETTMRHIYDYINQTSVVVDVSPIVPFPGHDPRRPDSLIEHYRESIGDWGVDPRHFLYAAESDPLDSYRSICQIDILREQTYGNLGGASTIVSPLGSKMLSVGLMMAAIERNLRVVYIECRGYSEPDVPAETKDLPHPLTHVWLDGEIYNGLERF